MKRMNGFQWIFFMDLGIQSFILVFCNSKGPSYLFQQEQKPMQNSGSIYEWNSERNIVY